MIPHWSALEQSVGFLVACYIWKMYMTMTLKNDYWKRRHPCNNISIARSVRVPAVIAYKPIKGPTWNLLKWILVGYALCCDIKVKLKSIGIAKLTVSFKSNWISLLATFAAVPSHTTYHNVVVPQRRAKVIIDTFCVLIKLKIILGCLPTAVLEVTLRSTECRIFVLSSSMFACVVLVAGI